MVSHHSDYGYCQDCKQSFDVRNLKGKICFNAVIVGNTLPKLSKRETRIKSKNKRYQHRVEQHKLPKNREIITMKVYPRTLNKNDQV
jgi:hypothetical protein